MVVFSCILWNRISCPERFRECRVGNKWVHDVDLCQTRSQAAVTGITYTMLTTCFRRPSCFRTFLICFDRYIPIRFSFPKKTVYQVCIVDNKSKGKMGIYPNLRWRKIKNIGGLSSVAIQTPCDTLRSLRSWHFYANIFFWSDNIHSRHRV